MDERMGVERRSRVKGRWAWLGLALLVPIPVGPAEASPIRRPSQVQRMRLAASVTTPGGYWDRYFAHALQVRSLRVQGPPALMVLSAAPAAQVSNSAFVDYLLWRRSLNPARFDFYHPFLAPILIQTQVPQPPNIPSLPGSLLPPTTVIPSTVPPDSPPDTPPPPPQVPEPSSWLVLLGMFTAAVAARRWARAHA
jgi:hypothetical protein